MSVDGQESPTATVVGNATTLDVEGKLYLGGLPVHYKARNIGNVSSGLCVGPTSSCCGCVVVVLYEIIILQCICLGYSV